MIISPFYHVISYKPTRHHALLNLQLPTDLTSAARWRSINSSIVDQPHHRFCHVGVAYNDALYIFGGYDVSRGYIFKRKT